jgi:hypothetical protein
MSWEDSYYAISRDLAAELRRRYFGRWRGGERVSSYKKFLLEFGTLEFWNLEVTPLDEEMR